MPKMILEKMIQRRRRGPRRLQLSALVSLRRGSATLLSLQGGARTRPVAALQRWKEKMLGTRTYQAPRRFHEAHQEPPDPKTKFPPCMVAVDCARAAKTTFLRSPSCGGRGMGGVRSLQSVYLAALPNRL